MVRQVDINRVTENERKIETEIDRHIEIDIYIYIYI